MATTTRKPSKSSTRDELFLREVKTLDQVEWLRIHRNDPETYKYFRQDKPITPQEQINWWKDNKYRVKLFIISNGQDSIGCVGFNLLNHYAQTAEFTIFILKEHQKKGYGKRALKELLRYGFEDLHLSSIYSETLDYPGENRIKFFTDLGFAVRETYTPKTYSKQGKKIPAIPFYMTKDMWRSWK